MTQEQSNENPNSDYPVHQFTTACRTITETDIVNFVNLVGLHEPYFIDMEFIKKNMSAEHQRRFAPAPLVISVGMGLVASQIKDVFDKVTKGQNAGALAGLVEINARALAGVYPGDTLRVEGDARIKKRTNNGYLLVDIKHIVKNQKDEVVLEFIETAIFDPPDD